MMGTQTPTDDRIGASRVESISVGNTTAPFPDETYMSRQAAVEAVNTVIDAMYDEYGSCFHNGTGVDMAEFYDSLRGSLQLALLEAHQRTGEDPFGDNVVADTITDTVAAKTDMSAGRIGLKTSFDNRLEAAITSVLGSLTEVVDNPHFDMERAAPTP